MTSVNQEKGDGKLLLAVVGLVVAGAAGIALLAGLSAHREAEQARTPSVATAIERPVPVQASFVRPAPVVGPGLEEKVPGTPADSIVVDPGADFVAVALAAYEQREFGKAAAYFEAQAERIPGRPWVEYMLGLSLWKDGRAGQAAEAMRRSIEADPGRIKPFVNLSRIENDRGEFEAALGAADEALTLAADDPEALFLRARSLRNLGRVDEAVVALEASLSLDAGNGYAHNLLGLIRIGQGQAQSAAEALARAAEREPEVAYIQNNLGMALELCDRDTEALVAYRRAVELDSGHTRAQLNLARLDPSASEDGAEEQARGKTIEPVAELAGSDEEEFVADAAVPR